MIPDSLENGLPLPGREKLRLGSYSPAGFWGVTSCCGAQRKAFTAGSICASTAERSFRWEECAGSGWYVRITRGNTIPRGQCVFMPFSTTDQPPPAKARAQAYQAREQYGMVWVCIGAAAWAILRNSPTVMTLPSASFTLVLIRFAPWGRA